MRLLYFYEKQRNVTIKELSVEQKYKAILTKSAILHYGINAAVVIVAAVFLLKIGEGIAGITGTDEDAFRILKYGITLRVGYSSKSRARYFLKDTRSVKKLLSHVLELLNRPNHHAPI